MATKLSVYRGALLIIKQRPIDALTDTDKSRYILDAVYDRAKALALEQGYWNFATRTVSIDSSVDVEPTFGFSYVFDKPDDWVSSAALAANEIFYPPLGVGEFVDEGIYIHANCDPLYLSYVSDGTSYGGDLSLWSASFERYFEHELAERIAPHLTTMGRDEFNELAKDKKRALYTALAKDAKNQAAQALPPGRLVRSRMGGNRAAFQKVT